MKRLLQLGVAGALVVVLPACADDQPEPETASEALERLAPARVTRAPAAPSAPAAGYRMTLSRIIAASPTDDEGRLRAERVQITVRRPFTEVVDDGLRRRLGFEQDSPNSVERAVLLRPLPSDPRPDVYPPDAGARTQRERDVAGRTCTVYRYETDEYCIDAAGLVLASRRGDTVEVATAVALIDEAPSPTEIAAELRQGVSDPARGSVRPLDPTSSPPGRDDWSLAAPPSGYSFVGRYATVPLSREVLTQGSQAILAGVADVYVRGIDTIVVDRGGKLNLTSVGESDLGALGDPRDVDLGPLGTGKVGIGGVGPFGYREVRAFPETGRYVVVAGTAPTDELLAVARALRSAPGTTLRYLDTP